MSVATFLGGIVFGLILGAALAALWFRSRNACAPEPSQIPADQILKDQSLRDQSLNEALQRIESHIRASDSQRQHMMGGLEHHLNSLSRETVALSQALRAPNSRGRWGELTLRRVAELAGMSAFCDFDEQMTASSESEVRGQIRPDMIVRLPGGRSLAVDAKVPLAAYLDAEAALDDIARRTALDRHAQQVARHVNQLSAREYWAQLQPAPELVVLFLAGDHFLSAALERDPELLDRALARKVLLATPVTLISILKGVSYGWKQERLAQNASELRRIAGEFYDRVRTFAHVYSESGKHLARAVEAYNQSAGSWEARMLPSLKRMRELGASAGDDAREPGRIDLTVRDPQILREPSSRAEPILPA